ncbi:MAG TPA: YciI family protein [Acidimicrobiales bacterium]|jgi:hypothetical protein
MKYVLFYESVDDFLPLAQENFPAHQERFMDFHQRGVLLMLGPFMDQSGDAMAVFTSREAAEEFFAGDPFVLNGVVKTWTIREWNEPLFET